MSKSIRTEGSDATGFGIDDAASGFAAGLEPAASCDTAATNEIAASASPAANVTRSLVIR
jgi:hypothetical protein